MSQTSKKKQVFIILFSQLFFLMIVGIISVYIFLSLEPADEVVLAEAKPVQVTFADLEKKESLIAPEIKFTHLNEPNQATKVVESNLSSGVKSTQRNNYLKMQNLSIDGKIVEGNKADQDYLLLQGFWLYPNTGYPDINSRKTLTPVIFGHRFFKKPPETETFHDLDKIKNGDIIEVGYNGKIYFYEVNRMVIVDKKDWGSIQPEEYDAIKLVTCTPNGVEDAPQRIVITAKLLK